MKKKNTTLLIITLVSIAALLGYSSYAIIAMGTTLENYNIFAQTSNGLAFTVDLGNNFNTNVSVNNMEVPNEGNTEVVNTSDNINITLATDGQKAICCTYDINWEWETDNNTNNQYHKSTNATNEYVLKSTYQTTYKNNGSVVSNSSEANNSFTQQLPDYGNSSKTLKSTEKICNKNGSTLNTEVVRKYTFNTVFYNLKDINQDALRRGVFKGHIVITNIKCKQDNNS